MTDTVKEGVAAPEIRLQTDADQPFDLAEQKGKNVVLYFYPKADTPGCTIEAHEFNDALKKFGKYDAEVYGISPDPPKAQSKFKDKCGLKFPLLCDVEHKVAEAYGVWAEKSMYGKKYMGVERTTFIIGKDGKVAKIFSKVKPAGHAEEVLEALAAL
jgi:thioredoxin-dependent peroxiredoxin